jgi:2-isopropylmalate synthase
LDLPRERQIDFARRAQALADERGVEIKPAELLALYEAAYGAVSVSVP